MTDFVRQPTLEWQTSVPGARWLYGDLHVHTLDDYLSPNLKAGISVASPPTQSDLKRFARHVLSLAVSRGIQVLGLTPHAISVDGGKDTSSVWTLVNVWNEENDDDGVPFRERIFSVLPGFEPSFSEGKRGVHLLFLFDPEVGWSFFSRAFQLLMGGVQAYKGATLQNSLKSASSGLAALTDLFRRERPPGDYICLAPHPFNSKGLFGEMGGQVMGDFPSNRLSAIEVSDDSTSDDFLNDSRRPWFKGALDAFRHSLFHASDAYDFAGGRKEPGPASLGYRKTLLKLATPRIEALRQCFIASDSRVRCIYVRNPNGRMTVGPDLPDPFAATHPWIRRITISGGKTFFTQSRTKQSFHFSPGLTCLIGGRMTGKSTILDGLRCHLGLPLPTDNAAATEVQSRANAGFLAGEPDIDVECAGAATQTEDWPARFFCQSELQQIGRDKEALEDLLFNLIPERGPTLKGAKATLASLDSKADMLVESSCQARSKVEEAEQAALSAKKAKDAIARYDKLGGGRLSVLDEEVSRSEAYAEQLDQLVEQFDSVSGELSSVDRPLPFSPETTAAIERPLLTRIQKAGKAMEAASVAAKTAIKVAAADAKRLHNALRKLRQDKGSEVTKAVIDAGGTREELSALDKNKGKAATFERLKLDAELARKKLTTAEQRLDEKINERERAIAGHRKDLSALVQSINDGFAGAIRVSLIPEGDIRPLDEWIRGLKQAGISRWWNERRTEDPLGLSEFRAAIRSTKLGDIGMSAAVSESLRTALTPPVATRLRGVRCPDSLHLEARVSEKPLAYKKLDEVSGGKRVSILLALLLNGEDDRPLVIDQPEDELDGPFLTNELLPLLRRLKGRRQIVFATHNPNIVVNGDADCVICLDATHEEGRVSAYGAIESFDVRQIIVDTVDGGKAAFELRAAKYGY